MSTHPSFHWPYFYLDDVGLLHDEDGSVVVATPFANDADAEQWLVDRDIRGNVRPLNDDSETVLQARRRGV